VQEVLSDRSSEFVMRTALKGLGDSVSRSYGGTDSTHSILSYESSSILGTVGFVWKSGVRLVSQLFYDEHKTKLNLALGL
jgi:hypothetical protein